MAHKGKPVTTYTTGQLTGVGVGVSQAINPYQNHTHTHNLQANTTMLGMHALSQQEYEFYVEAKNMLADMANDEELPESYRGQARRLVARCVLSKL